MSKRLDTLNRTLSHTASPSSSSDALPNFVEILPNITTRGLLRAYDPALISSYGRSFNNRLTDIRRAHSYSHARLTVGLQTRESLLVDVDATAGSATNNAIHADVADYVTYSGATTDIAEKNNGEFLKLKIIINPTMD